ncbi:MAG: B12-binding domain-containing radical SAM protein [Candidatus Helarchaeota archaeon]
MRILLINPTTRNYSKGITIAAAAPLGLLSLASVLREAGHKVMIYDHNVENDGFKECKKFDPEMVGITSFTGPMILDALRMSGYYHDQGIPVVWGGIHPSLLPIQTIKNSKIDMVVVGEGEETIVDLANSIENHRNLENVKGLIWKETKDDGIKIRENAPRKFIEDLDSLPFPAWELIDVRKYKNTLMGWENNASEIFSIQTSRGCPFRCGFCYNTIFNNRKWRSKSADRVIEEISFLKEKFKIDKINFRDDNFVVNNKRVMDICRNIYKNKLDITFAIDCRVDLLTRNMARLLKIAGCNQIYFGIESGSPRILNFIKKDITLQQAMDAVNLCKKVKIKSSTSFILGLPTEKQTDLLLTRKFIYKLMPDNLLVKIFVPYPGTFLYDYVIKNGLFNPPLKLEDWGLDWMNFEFKLSDTNPKVLKNIMKNLYIKHFILKFPKFAFNLIKTSLTKFYLHKLLLNGLRNLSASK